MIQRCNARIDALSMQVAELTRAIHLTFEELSDHADKQKELNARSFFSANDTGSLLDLFKIIVENVDVKRDTSQAKTLLDRMFSQYNTAVHFADKSEIERNQRIDRKHLDLKGDLPNSGSHAG